MTQSFLSITEGAATANQIPPASLHLLAPTGQGTGSVCLNLHLATKSQTICLSEKSINSQIPGLTQTQISIAQHNSYAEATLIKTALIISLILLTKSIKSGQFFSGQEQARNKISN